MNDKMTIKELSQYLEELIKGANAEEIFKVSYVEGWTQTPTEPIVVHMNNWIVIQAFYSLFVKFHFYATGKNKCEYRSGYSENETTREFTREAVDVQWGKMLKKMEQGVSEYVEDAFFVGSAGYDETYLNKVASKANCSVEEVRGKVQVAFEQLFQQYKDAVSFVDKVKITEKMEALYESVRQEESLINMINPIIQAEVSNQSSPATLSIKNANSRRLMPANELKDYFNTLVQEQGVGETFKITFDETKGDSGLLIEVNDRFARSTFNRLIGYLAFNKESPSFRYKDKGHGVTPEIIKTQWDKMLKYMNESVSEYIRTALVVNDKDVSRYNKEYLEGVAKKVNCTVDYIEEKIENVFDELLERYEKEDVSFVDKIKATSKIEGWYETVRDEESLIMIMNSYIKNDKSSQIEPSVDESEIPLNLGYH